MLRLFCKLLFLLFGRTSETSIIYEKKNCFCFIYLQTQKSELDINMKHVSYKMASAYPD